MYVCVCCAFLVEGWVLFLILSIPCIVLSLQYFSDRNVTTNSLVRQTRLKSGASRVRFFLFFLPIDEICIA